MLFTCKNNIYKNKKIKNILKGFTLVEMLVVIAIIIIIIGAGFSMFSSRKNYEYKAEVDKIYKFITDAQANATKSSPVITANNQLIRSISFNLPNNMPDIPNNQSYIALFTINKILNNNVASLNLEYFEKIRREVVINDNNMQGTSQQVMINYNSSFNLPTFYDQNLFLNNNNYPISYMVLIRNNNRFLPIVFRTDGSLAANTELYVQIRYLNNNRFRTYFIGINGKNVRKYVR
ncbi:MAG: prepilin-type N-terminal cleavage/methylation domain-containing protein [bacterium]